MTPLQDSKSAPFRAGLWAFLLTFFLLLSLLTTQFIYRYSEELFHSNLDTWTQIKVCGFTTITFMSLALPISVTVMTVVYFRKIFRAGKTDIKRTIRKVIFPVITWSIASFLLVSFIIPKANLQMTGLLYDITQKRPDEPLARTDLKLFSKAPLVNNLIQLQQWTDSTERKLDKIRKRTVYDIMRSGSTVQIKEVLKDTLAKAIGITEADFANEDPAMYVRDTSEKVKNYLHHYLRYGYQDIEKEKINILKYRIRLSAMIGFPFFITIAFFLGMFIGILNRHQKYLVLALIGIYLTVFPLFYYPLVWFEDMAKKQSITPFQGQLYFLFILAAITFLLYLYTASQLRNEKMNKPS